MTKRQWIAVLAIFLLSQWAVGAPASAHKVLVKFKTNSSIKVHNLKELKGFGIQSVEPLPLVSNLYEVNLDEAASSTLSLEIAVQLLSQRQDVEYAQPSRKFKPMVLDNLANQSYGPNNPPWNEPVPLPPQPLKDPNSNANWNIIVNGIKSAWKHTKGAGVVVAVVDTGVDYNHEDLGNNIWRNSGEIGLDKNGEPKASNGIDDDKNGFVDDHMGWDFAENDNLPWDDYGHGTHVAGIIAATQNNGIGANGVAPEAKVMPLRFMTAGGQGDDADAIRAFAYAKAHGAHIINNSWGGAEPNPALEEAFKALEDSGIVMVNAAGNEGTDIAAYAVYPARYKFKHTVTVAANNTNNTIINWSCHSSIFVQSASAGYDVHSTMPNNGYRHMSGTSMAAPNFSAAVALIKSLRPEWSPQEIKAHLRKHDMGQSQSFERMTEWRKYSRPGFSVKALFKN